MIQNRNTTNKTHVMEIAGILVYIPRQLLVTVLMKHRRKLGISSELNSICKIGFSKLHQVNCNNIFCNTGHLNVEYYVQFIHDS